MRFSRAGGQTLCGFFFFGLLFFLLSGGKSFFHWKIAALCYNLSTVLRQKLQYC